MSGGGGKNDYQHLVQEQLPELDYCVNDSPPLAETILVGFQHYLTMVGTTVLVTTPLVYAMGGNDRDKARVIQTLLFASGINTLIQSFLGTRLPAIVGGSYAYILPIFSIINSPKLRAITDDRERFLHSMKAIQGALICASILQIVLGFSGLWGIFSRYTSPLTIGPVILMVGIGMFQLGFPGVGKCVQIGIPQILLILLFSQYLKTLKASKKMPFFERFAIVIAVALTWAYAHFLTITGAYKHSSELGQIHCRTDRANLIRSSPWIRVPYPLEWGAPTFNASHAFGMLAGAIVSLVESTGSFYGIARLAGATPPPSYVLSRGIGWQGVGIFINGIFGTAAGPTISVENAGLVGITRVGSRRTIQVAAFFMIFFSLFGKFGGIFASIPAAMVAGIYCVLFGVLAASGVSYLQFTNLNLPRNLIILGFSVFMAFSVPEYIREFTISAGHGPVHTKSHWFNDILNVTLSSGPVIALIVGVVLDNTLKLKVTKKDRGANWWKNFRTFGADKRNEEFYKLPFNLNKFFPPV
ncbi:hypothetical protein SELMODRAFT_76475 [Selaginella moellendorffii]|uniref:Uncharacterized protein n=1 Tax=Selaginella moellendorffii TaxID=88036 RepID=D8QTB7_SELML|nr:nucleobase-ascorbate transporter 2 [Selaginella moellendorffii]XP_002980826.1 nucleobase-ascorbate transporter 2 [Selaginella moellendorffii]EFJ18011.1 hypothetical protein SELMODRAFT_113360 [Selaginella moellendorffii]EFJ37085.1 hypothetical protein SELMODRAFT_76475 [Selaginella moellendorffii]|eukprot:XP_002961825.1 nucleobase-ascorbate transporter 2 [Selaginella moellendorffii]